MRRWMNMPLLGALGALVALGACDGEVALECGAGEQVGDVCYYASAITVTGFLCPESLPFGETLSDGSQICAPDEGALESFNPEDIPSDETTPELGSQQPSEPDPVDLSGGGIVDDGAGGAGAGDAEDDGAKENASANRDEASGNGTGQGDDRGRGQHADNGTGDGAGQGRGSGEGSGD